jgi:hypothetical protein
MQIGCTACILRWCSKQKAFSQNADLGNVTYSELDCAQVSREFAADPDTLNTKISPNKLITNRSNLPFIIIDLGEVIGLIALCVSSETLTILDAIYHIMSMRRVVVQCMVFRLQGNIHSISSTVKFVYEKMVNVLYMERILYKYNI